MVKVSVIMPVFNESNLIEKSIESVNNQNLKDIELICINYSSTDNCLETLNKFSKKYNFIKIINGENLSLAEARNKGIKESFPIPITTTSRMHAENPDTTSALITGI